MKKSSVTLLTAIFIAMVFTLSCTSESDNGGGGNENGNSNTSGGSSSGGNSGSLSENSQVFNYHDGSRYIGSGVMKTSLHVDNDDTLITIGSVTNGIVKLELPQTVPDKYLYGIEYFEKRGGEISPQDAKVSEVTEKIYLLDNNEDLIGNLLLTDADRSAPYLTGGTESVFYLYSSKAATFDLSYCDEDFTEDFLEPQELTCKNRVNTKAGWNKIYYVIDDVEEEEARQSTENILTKEVKWYLRRK